MTKIVLKKSYEDNFNNNYVPKLFLNMMRQEVKKSDYKYLFNYLNSEYQITQDKLLSSLKDNLIHSKIGKQDFLIIDNNRYIKSGLKLETLVNLITFGDRNIRGCDLFTKIINYLNNNMESIFFYYCMFEREE